MSRLAVVIGRFQPFHAEHKSLLNLAFDLADNVLLCIGSVSNKRSVSDPWDFDERDTMIRSTLGQALNQRLVSTPVKDFNNDQEWRDEIVKTANMVCRIPKLYATKIVLVGHFKDNSSYYLSLFPEWEMFHYVSKAGISAVDIREHYFVHGSYEPFRDFLDVEVCKYLDWFKQQPMYTEIQHLYATHFIEKAKSIYI